MDAGAARVTELVEIAYELDAKLLRDFGDMKVGDEKEFSMMVDRF